MFVHLLFSFLHWNPVTSTTAIAITIITAETNTNYITTSLLLLPEYYEDYHEY